MRIHLAHLDKRAIAPAHVPSPLVVILHIMLYHSKATMYMFKEAVCVSTRVLPMSEPEKTENGLQKKKASKPVRVRHEP